MDSGERNEKFQAMYRKHFRRLARFLVATFHLSEEDGEDLAQQAFLQFFEALEEYRGDAEWAFMEQIARRLALNRIRYFNAGSRKGKTIEIDDPELRFDPPAPPGLDYAEKQQTIFRQRLLHRAIGRLPRGQRQCMLLWLDDRSYEEIAKILRITVDAVKSRLRDAKAELAERLGGPEPPEDKK